MLLQDLLGYFIILHAESEHRLTLRVWNARIEIIDVQLGFKQRGHDIGEFSGGVDSHDQQLRLGERELMFFQKIAGLLGIIHQTTDDGAFRGVEDSEPENMDAMPAEKLDQVVQLAKPVGSED